MALRLRLSWSALVALVVLLCVLLPTSLGPASSWAASRGGSSGTPATAHAVSAAGAQAGDPRVRPSDLSSATPSTDTATPAPTTSATTIATDTPLPTAGTLTPGTGGTGTPTTTLSPSPTPTDTATPSALSGTATLTPTASATASTTPSPTPTTPPTTTASLSASLLAAPLSFEPNVGQFTDTVSYVARGAGYTLFLTPAEAALVLAQPQTPPTLSGPDLTAPTPPSRTVLDALLIQYVGAQPSPQLTAADPLPGTTNYFVGSDPNAWHTGIATYGSVAYHGLYPGIDLVYHGSQQHLEYDWQVAPGADPSQIALAISGTSGLSLDSQGNLVIGTAIGPVLEQAPVAYQIIAGQRQPVSVQFTLTGTNQVGLNVGRYDTSQPLIIDPVLSYSTYLGGSGDEVAFGVATDSSGNAYVTGYTTSPDFPLKGGIQTSFGSKTGLCSPLSDVFVTKFNVVGSALVYSTYLGGGGCDLGESIAVDSGGQAYVTGETTSGSAGTTSFPLKNPIQGTNGGGFDAFISKINATGQALVYSTYLGGSGDDAGFGLALDSQTHVYVTGYTSSTNFPTVSALQTSLGGGTCGSSPCRDAFVTKVNQAGTAWTYSTYLGGSGMDSGHGIAVDSSFHAYVTGATSSTNFLTTSGVYQTSLAGSQNAFVTEVNDAGNGALYSTYLGGNGSDGGQGIAVDSGGNAYVDGTTSSTTFPTLKALQSSNAGGAIGDDAFVTKLNSTATHLLYSTYLGGTGDDSAQSIALDSAGSATIAGYTLSPNFPLASPLQATLGGYEDAFVARIDPSDSSLLYSTYLGGSQASGGVTSYTLGTGVALDGDGNAYLSGYTDATDYPTTTGAYSGTTAGGADAIVAKLGSAQSGTIPWHQQQSTSLGDGLNISVDVADGHVTVNAAAMDIPGRGPDLNVGAVWDSSLSGMPGTPLAGWLSSTQPGMTGALTGTVTYTASDGTLWSFPYTGNPSSPGPYTAYHTPPGFPWQLSTSTSGYTLTNVLDSSTLTFDSQGRYLATADAYGNAAVLTYSSGRPITWTAAGGYNVPGGRAISLGYDGSGRLNDVQSPLWQKGGGQGQHVTYAYNGSNQLTSLVRGAGSTDAVTETFGYSGTQLVTVTTGSGHQWAISYDSSGRASSVTSPASGTVGQAGYSPANTTQYTYSPGQTVVVAGAGSTTPLTTTYTLDVQGQVTALADGLGNTSATGYDTDHDVVTSTTPNGNTTTTYYQYVGPNASTGLITETVEPQIRAYTFTNSLSPVVTRNYYDPATNDLTETVNGEGGISLFSYDGHHSVVTTTQALLPTCDGCSTYTWQGSLNRYDRYGQRTSSIDGRAITVSSHGVASLNQSLALSYTSSYTYTPNGDLASVATPPIATTLNGTTSTSPVTTTYGYGTDGDLTSLTTPNGNTPGSTPSSYTTTYSYDHLGRQIKVTESSVTLYTGANVTPVEQTIYDGEGHVVQQIDANGDVTNSSYDPQGRLVSQTNPVSGTTIYTYSATEQSMVQDPQGNVTRDNYDPAGRLIQVTAPISGVTQYAYDPAGNTTVITAGDGITALQVETSTYDALNEVISATITGVNQPLSSTTTQTSYDHDGNVVEVQQPNGDVTFNTYNLADQLLNTEIDSQPINGPTQTTQESYSYDAAGNLIETVDFDGRDTKISYDAGNRPVQSMDIYTSTATITTTTGFDPNGNTISQTEITQTLGQPQQTHTYTATFNSNDWVTSSSDDGLITNNGYDAAGQERTQTIIDGHTPVTTVLDAEGRATAIGENYGSTGPFTNSFGYNSDDLPITAALPGSINVSSQYDPNNRLTHYSTTGPAGVTNPLSSADDFGYNALGWLTTLTDTLNSSVTPMTYTHDSLGRLTQWAGQQNGPETWGYDGNGNIITNTEFLENQYRTTAFTYSQSQPNELLQQQTAGSYSFTAASGQTYNNVPFGTEFRSYDKYGNTTSITSTDPFTSKYYLNDQYFYDAQSRLITSTTYSEPCLGTYVPLTVTMGYNAQGERSRYTVTVSGTVLVDEHFQYRSDELGQVSVPVAGTLTGCGSGIGMSAAYTDTYLYDQSGTPLELIRQQGLGTHRYWYETDGQGDVVALTDSTGNVVDRYLYDPWGELLPYGVSESVPQQLRYRGYWWDNELGKYWVNVRQLDPEWRWLQPDPSEANGVRTYVYVSDDPVDFSDPFGFSGVCDWFLLGGTLCGIGEWVKEHSSVAYAPASKHNLSQLYIWVRSNGIGSKLSEINPMNVALFAGGGPEGRVAEIALAWVGERLLGFAARIGLDQLLGRAVQTCVTEHSFPAGTQVATPQGTRAIETLHVGDKVLAENPATGKIESEPVRSVIQDPVSPLIAVHLSDRTAITVTAGHPFWVDDNAMYGGVGWRQAGQLRLGDRLRSARGGEVLVTGLQRGVGRAVVYTLEVANDHTFFVGTDQVLVHNAIPQCYDIIRYGTTALRGLGRVLQKHHAVLNEWAAKNLKGYVKSDAPAVVLTAAEHDLTRAEYGRWSTRLVGFGGRIDWQTISPDEIIDLSEQMFDAADVPLAVRRDYYRAFRAYVDGGLN